MINKSEQSNPNDNFFVILQNHKLIINDEVVNHQFW